MIAPGPTGRERRCLRLVLSGSGLILVQLFCLTIWAGVSTDFPSRPWGWVEVPLESEPVDLWAGSGLSETDRQSILELLLTKRRRVGVPALSVAAAHDGNLVLSASIGWADVVLRRPIDRATSFRIGSTSKAITATSLARLRDSGIVELDRTIAEQGVQVPARAWRRLTPRQLASHTAGMPGYEENRDWWGIYQTLRLGRAFDSVSQALDVFDGTSLLFEPGTGFHYSSFDTTLLAHVLVGLSGQSFPELLEQEILSPLGLDHTFLAGRAPAAAATATDFRVDSSGRARPWRDVDLSLKWAGGGMLSTPSDLVRIGSGWLSGTYVTPRSRIEFWTAQTLADGRVNAQCYGIGWRSDSSDRIRARHPLRKVHHGGVSKGAMSWLVVYPGLGLVVAITVNARTESFQSIAAVDSAMTARLVEILGLRMPVMAPKRAAHHDCS